MNPPRMHVIGELSYREFRAKREGDFGRCAGALVQREGGARAIEFAQAGACVA